MPIRHNFKKAQVFVCPFVQHWTNFPVFCAVLSTLYCKYRISFTEFLVTFLSPLKHILHKYCQWTLFLTKHILQVYWNHLRSTHNKRWLTSACFSLSYRQWKHSQCQQPCVPAHACIHMPTSYSPMVRDITNLPFCTTNTNYFYFV